MRSTSNRIRQVVSFELIGILIVTPLFAWGFDHPMGDMGVLVVLGATAATAWNYLFNLIFDHVLNWRRGGSSVRPQEARSVPRFRRAEPARLLAASAVSLEEHE